MKRILHLIILSSCMITGCICMLASCKNGNSYNNGKKDLDPNKPTVTVTIEPFRYFVEQIAGDDVNVNVMVPAGSSPETYEPTPQQMVDLSQSVFYFKVGQIGFEKTWMKKLQQNAPDMKVIDTSAGIAMLKTQSGNIDPHTWMSVKSADIITSNIAKALMEKYPKKAEEYKKRLMDFRKNKLDKLQNEIDKYQSFIKGEKQKSFVIYHPTLTYFAKENGLKQYAIEEEGREPSITQLKELIQRAKSEGINLIFVQKEFSNRNIQVFIDATLSKAVEINPLSYDWEGQMLLITKEIAQSGKK